MSTAKATMDDGTARDLLRIAAQARLLFPRGKWLVDGNAAQVLVALALDPAATTKDLGVQLGMAPSVVSQALRKLKSASLVTQRFDSERTRTVSLTPKGSRQLAAILDHARQVLDAT